MTSNISFLFIKPHALTDAFKKEVVAKIEATGMQILKEGQIDAATIDKDMLIDKHYYAIASKATILKPDHMPVPEDKFREKFGIDFEEALDAGTAKNAKEACEEFDLDASGLSKVWNEAKNSGNIVKLGGGFYCGKLQSSGKELYVFNGFFMEMRNQFVKPGAAIYYYVVEWNALEYSWEDFRCKMLGPTDPAQAPADSLRGILNNRWKEFGLTEGPNTGNNGVHASASPLEALAERINWLGATAQNDPYGKILLNNGITAEMIKEWSLDPQKKFEGETTSVFDLMENYDADRCLVRCQKLAREQNAAVNVLKNSAFVFIKPHAVNEKVIPFVKESLEAKGIRIVQEGHIEASEIDKKQLIDKHYYAIASKATLLKPDSFPVPAGKFKDKFGVEWSEVLKSGSAVNAKDACERFGVSEEELGKVWKEAQTAGNVVKLGGGFYCGHLHPPDPDKEPLYVFNAFFMGLRGEFVKPGAAIRWFCVEWDMEELSWEEFRMNIIGSTDPSVASPLSLRRLLYSKWKDYDLDAQPNTGNNGVHASASAFEGFVERMNWIGEVPSKSEFGQFLLRSGITEDMIKEWSLDPQVTYGTKAMSAFDSFEDMDADRCLVQCQLIAGLIKFPEPPKPSVPPANDAIAVAGASSVGVAGSVAAASSAPAPDFSGHLWKRAPPGKIKLKKFQKRYVTLGGGCMSWQEPGEGKPIKGTVDFSVNECVVVACEEDSVKFVVRPDGGSWSFGGFTGATTGREFLFDSTDSESDRATWIDAIKKQIQIGQAKPKPKQ